MYLFILESFGTQELILIGIVALIIFGPRKLPEFAKTIAKTMAEFRKVTGEFKSTWEKEVAEDKQMLQTLGEDPLAENNSISSTILTVTEDKQLVAPQIKELDAAQIEKLFKKKGIPAQLPQKEEPQVETATLSKKDWL